MGLTNYIKDTQAEMAHVNWPTRSETIRFTIAVIVVSVLTAVILSVSDYVFARLLTLLFK